MARERSIRDLECLSCRGKTDICARQTVINVRSCNRSYPALPAGAVIGNGCPVAALSIMLSFADHHLLRRPTPDVDHVMEFRRIDGDPAARVIYFLPWQTGYLTARAVGMLPLPFLACYEMPPAIVSSQPTCCVEALACVVDDARSLVRSVSNDLSAFLVVGLSIGTFAAAVLAASMNARLCAIAGADRGDLMLWQSPAATEVRRRAERRGFTAEDYAYALRGLNPVDRLDDIGQGSIFLSGDHDPFIPQARRANLHACVGASRKAHQSLVIAGGHVSTMVRSRQVQQRMLRDLVGSAAKATTSESCWSAFS